MVFLEEFRLGKMEILLIHKKIVKNTAKKEIFIISLFS